MLSAENYREWSIAISFILDVAAGWQITQGIELPPPEPELPPNTSVAVRAAAFSLFEQRIESYDKWRAQAVAIIYGSCTSETHAYINTERDPATIWNLLKTQLDTAAARVAPVQLTKEFYKEKFPPNG